MHLTLDSNIGICNARCKELAESAEEEGHHRGHFALLLDRILHLLKERVLQNGVDDEHESRQHAGEERLRPFVLKKGHQRAHGRGLLPALGGLARLLGITLALTLGPRGNAGVDDPDGVGDDDGRGTGNGTSQDGLNGCELGLGAAAADSSLLEESLGPFIPVVVDEVRNADTEQRRVDARVETGDTLAGNDLLDGIDEFGFRLPRLDLGAGREGN